MSSVLPTSLLHFSAACYATWTHGEKTGSEGTPAATPRDLRPSYEVFKGDLTAQL